MEGYPEEVCLAIHEHYLPARAGGRLPTCEVGAVVSLADRMDTIVGCFAIGLIPTGKADPFALRRHALAIIRILENMEWDLSLNEFIKISIKVIWHMVLFHDEAIYSQWVYDSYNSIIGWIIARGKSSFSVYQNIALAVYRPLIGACDTTLI